MIEVKISEDGMMAEVFVSPEEDEYLTEKLVEDTLRLEGVQAGIDKAAITEILEKKLFNRFIPVAKGKLPVNGLDGYYKYFFTNEDDGKPTIREDGSVNYARKIINVNEGDLLAEYYPETGGAYGFNVFSKMLLPLRGKPARPFRCLNVRLEENKYYAAKNGQVTASEGTLSVQNILEVRGDTTYDDGDIDFNGDVHVLGNICNGITVKATGSVIVDGVIENGKVYAGLDVSVNRGIHGQGTTKDGQYLLDEKSRSEMTTIVEAKGQLRSKFIDHAFIKTEGDIFIDYAVGSVLISEGKITAYGSKGAIVGGSITALLGVDAEAIGNSAALATEIKVGEDKKFVKKCEETKEKLKEIEDNIFAYQNEMEPEKLQDMLEQMRKQVEIYDQKCKDMKVAPIIVRKVIHQNVRMYFGKLAVPDVSDKFNVEFRKIGGQVLCKSIGAFKPSELNYGIVDKEIEREAGQKPSILIIDDDTSLLRMVNHMLEADYQVAVATSGRVGRKYLEKNSVDLILLDYMMPDENGVEVLKSLRDNEDTKDIPVSFMTGLHDKKKILECLSMNPAGYIIKPVEREKLLAKIHAILSERPAAN